MSNPLTAIGAVTAPALDAEPARVRQTAEDFEALLLAQMLRQARTEGGWFQESSGESGSILEFAEQQMAGILSRSGGLGLGQLITNAISNTGAKPPKP